MKDTAPDPYTMALGKEVAIGSVDKELRLLWEEDKASTNASLINLAVYSEADEAILRNSEKVQAITREHACRAILIGIDRDCPTASIRAWITAHCHLSQGRKSVCCEQLAFQLTGRATGRLRNTVFAHLNSDLPLVFWWQGELSPIFSERLYSLIDRFVFDSSEWSNPLESFQTLQKARNNTETFLPMDLEWTRSYSMRVALAGLFDEPMAARSIDQIQKVSITAHPSHRMAAMQVLAWIAGCLKWRQGMDLGLEKAAEDGRYYFESPTGVDVEAYVECDASSAPLGMVELSGAGCTVRVSREAGSSVLKQELDGCGHSISLGSPAGSDEAEDLIVDQLSRGGKNTLYLRTLPT
ncbi:MAG: glucose-6-phosphate dehydrogenase assembly protein OpcA, partial [Akkermansiaceae bacterium]